MLQYPKKDASIVILTQGESGWEYVQSFSNRQTPR